MSGKLDKIAGPIYDSLFNQTWKRYVVGAGGGATAWKVIEKLIALHFPTSFDKLLAWGTLFVLVSVVAALGRRGKSLRDVATDVEETIEENT
jgi:hypothetical protein